MKSENLEMSGLGWRYVESQNAIHLLFEAKGLSVDDETGERSPAGVKVAIKSKQPLTLVDKNAFVEKCDALIKTIMAEGFEGIPPELLTPLTWQKYVEEGYEE